MSLLNEILNWTQSLPNWQRDACRRLLHNESMPSDEDLSELYTLLKKENGIETEDDLTATPLAIGHLPAELGSNETVTLVALKRLENVNRIPNNHVLKFSETGMTVIYGGNGTGKSGYARVMKRACRARDQSEPVHPNANDPLATAKVPIATFDVIESGVSQELFWSLNSASPNKLSSISVFDSKCARSYITTEKNVAFLPYGLDIVESLANHVLPKLASMLDAEIASIDTSKLLFEHFISDTAVGKEIEKLSADSDSEAICNLGTLTVAEINRIDELCGVLKEADPLSKARDVKLSATRLKEYAEKLSKSLPWVSERSLEKLQRLTDEKNEAEAVEAKAADALRAGEDLLPGTGDQVWKLLFEAAKRYATEVAYPGEKFPPSADGRVCPLCQQELQQASTLRLQRFNKYIKDDVARTAAAKRQELDTAMEALERADIEIGAQEALQDELSELDPTISDGIDAFQSCLNSRRKAMLQCLNSSNWSSVPPLVESPRARIRQVAAYQLKESRTLASAADADKRKMLQEEIDQLSARQRLAKVLSAVLELIERMKRRKTLERCRPSLKTRSISDKSKEFATMAVTEELKKALDREFDALGVGHIQTKLKERIDHGKILHQLLLNLPTAKKIEEILSEGEQRAIALASFFAELALANHSCGIVFDDPVSSLDHWRRRDVARRMVEEAMVRQVIVFTHDTSFLGQLRDEIDAAGVPSSMSFLEWQGENPGCVNIGLPWDHQSYKARIDALEKAQRQLAKNWPPYPSEENSMQMGLQYDRLRATLERVIQDVVFNGVVKRYRDWIRVDSLKDVVGFDQAEYEAIDKLHKRCCNVVLSHDPSSAKAATVPTATDFGNDIATLKAIVEMIKDRRKAAKMAS